jgi:hypothetical protein
MLQRPLKRLHPSASLAVASSACSAGYVALHTALCAGQCAAWHSRLQYLQQQKIQRSSLSYDLHAVTHMTCNGQTMTEQGTEPNFGTTVAVKLPVGSLHAS